MYFESNGCFHEGTFSSLLIWSIIIIIRETNLDYWYLKFFYKEIISKSSWVGGHDISTGETRPFPSRGSHKPSSLLLQLRGRGWGVKEDKGNGVAFRRDRVTRIRYTFRTGVGDPPSPSLGTQVSKPLDHKETKKKRQPPPPPIVLHTQSSYAPPSRPSSAGRPHALSSLGDPGVVSSARSP